MALLSRIFSSEDRAETVLSLSQGTKISLVGNGESFSLCRTFRFDREESVLSLMVAHHKEGKHKVLCSCKLKLGLLRPDQLQSLLSDCLGMVPHPTIDQVKKLDQSGLFLKRNCEQNLILSFDKSVLTDAHEKEFSPETLFRLRTAFSKQTEAPELEEHGLLLHLSEGEEGIFNSEGAIHPILKHLEQCFIMEQWTSHFQVDVANEKAGARLLLLINAEVVWEGEASGQHDCSAVIPQSCEKWQVMLFEAHEGYWSLVANQTFERDFGKFIELNFNGQDWALNAK